MQRIDRLKEVLNVMQHPKNKPKKEEQDLRMDTKKDDLPDSTVDDKTKVEPSVENKDDVNKNLDKKDQKLEDKQLDNKEERKEDISFTEEKEKDEDSKDDKQHVKTENGNDLNQVICKNEKSEDDLEKSGDNAGVLKPESECEDKDICKTQDNTDLDTSGDTAAVFKPDVTQQAGIASDVNNNPQVDGTVNTKQNIDSNDDGNSSEQMCKTDSSEKKDTFKIIVEDTYVEDGTVEADLHLDKMIDNMIKELDLRESGETDLVSENEDDDDFIPCSQMKRKNPYESVTEEMEANSASSVDKTKVNILHIYLNN